jgi:hypothetical protein
MSKSRVVVAFVAIAFVLPLAVSGQKAKPPKPPVYATVAVTDEVNSGGSTVQAGRDVATYGPINQELYIHGSLLPPDGDAEYSQVVAELRALGPDADGYYGPYSGQIRVLNDRLDYWFDTSDGCGEAITSTFPCRFRAIVVDGVPVYEKIGKTRVLTRLAFNDGRYLLDYRWCDPATNPECYVKLYGCYDDRDCPGIEPGDPDYYIYATLSVLFQLP